MMSLLAIGANSKKNSISIQRYDPKLDEWNEFYLKTPIKLQYYIAALNNQLIFSTAHSTYFPGRLARYDIDTSSWLPMSQIQPQEHQKQCTAGRSFSVYNGQLYAIGGMQRNRKSFAFVQSWDPYTDTWRSVADMKYKRRYAGCAVLNDRLFVAGGRDGAMDFLQYTEYFSATTQQWKRCADMNEACTNFTLTAADGCLYAVGGFVWCNKKIEFSHAVQRYVAKTNKWTTLSPMNHVCNSRDCIYFENRLWVVGGNDFDGVEHYYPIKDEWTLAKSLKSGGIVKCCVLPIQIVDQLMVSCLG